MKVKVNVLHRLQGGNHEAQQAQEKENQNVLPDSGEGSDQCNEPLDPALREVLPAQVCMEPGPYIHQILGGGQVGLLHVHYEPCLCEHLEGCLNQLLYLLRRLHQDEDVVEVWVQLNTHQPEPSQEWGLGVGEDLWGPRTGQRAEL